jgi:hypothetical protein
VQQGEVPRHDGRGKGVAPHFPGENSVPEQDWVFRRRLNTNAGAKPETGEQKVGAHEGMGGVEENGAGTQKMGRFSILAAAASLVSPM